MRNSFDEQQTPAFELMFSLHKYSRWVSSLTCARPLGGTAAGRELQRLADLKRRFPGTAEKISAVVVLHLKLLGCMSSAEQGLLRTPEFLDLVRRQGEAVADVWASQVQRGAARRLAAIEPAVDQRVAAQIADA